MRLTQDQLHQLDRLRRRHHLSLILLHGSHLTGKLHPDSDLDIAALCQRKTRLNLLSLITSLNRIFKTNRVDLTNLTQADPLLIYQVTQHSQLLSGDDHLYTQLQLKALHVYQDYLPYLRLEQQLVEARTKSYVTA